MEILRLMAILLLIILVIVIGSKVLYNDKFAQISGTVTLTASPSSGTSYSQTNFTLNYPSGFNKNNTVVVGFKCKLQETGSGNYIFGYTPDKMSTSAVSGAYPRTIRLDDTNMTVSIYNLASTKKMDYVIYLMKID